MRPTTRTVAVAALAAAVLAVAAWWWSMKRKAGNTAAAPIDFDLPAPVPEATTAKAARRPFNANELHPDMRAKWVALADAARAQGMPIAGVSGLRTGEEQNRLADQRPRVTNARAGQSPHNMAAAVDFAFIKTDGRLSFAPGEPWAAVGAIAERLGLVWGGRFTTIPGGDLGHVELSGWRALPLVG